MLNNKQNIDAWSSNQRLIILNGPAGVGKTTVGTELAKRNANGVCIHGDDLKRFIKTRTSPQIETGLAYKNGAMLAANYLFAGYNLVVFEFVFENSMQITRFLDSFKYDCPVYLFTLWASYDEIFCREAARTNREKLGTRVAECYNVMLENLPQLGTVIDTEKSTPVQIAENIISLCG